MKGRFVMVDGLDGSGKGVMVDALGEHAEASGMNVLDLRAFALKERRLPEPEQLSAYQAIISAEPTFSYVGQAIRDELVRAGGRKYSALSLAQAFALDREVLYRRIILPALQQGIHIFQERGLVSSLVYQPVQEHIPLSELLRLPGNKLAMQHAPNMLVIATVRPETVIARLGQREKKDDSIFDTLSFQRQLDERYRSSWLKRLFEKYGSRVVYVDTDEPRTVEETKRAAVDLWNSIH